jgi:glycosyltransferase involved in cell wall biosynthesis
MKTIFITNIPAPYREKMHEIIYKKLNKSYFVIYCAKIDPNRKWLFPIGRYKKKFLKAKTFKLGSAYTYLWSNILSVLKNENPKVIILGGLSIPMILAFFWGKFNNCKIIALSDATIQSEKTLTFFHKLLRIFFYKKMDAYIGISQKTIRLFNSYGAKKNKCFISPLAIDNADYKKSFKKYEKRKYDILLCGRFIPRKLFNFSIDVISKLYKEKKKLRIKLVGDGPLKNQIILRLNNMGIKYKYSGFVQPSLLKNEYTSAKLFLFPTLRDPWGVVANESCAAGTPVITCNNAGAANELIKNNFNGCILKLNTNIWMKKIKKLFDNKKIMNNMSKNALKSVEKFDSITAAKGVVNAVQFVSK